MDELIQVVAAPLLIIFTIINFVIYHKIFTVYYFNLQKGCFTEILGCVLVAIFETAVVIKLGGIILIIVLIIGGSFLLVGVLKNKKESEGNDTIYDVGTNEESNTYKDIDHKTEEIKPKNFNTEDIGNNHIDESNNTPERVEETYKNIVSPNMFCPYCGKQINEEVKFCMFCGKPNIKAQ